MKKVIIEQSTKNPFIGKTVIFYNDSLNTKVLGKAKILSMKQKNDGDVEIDIDDKRENKFGREIVFSCSNRQGGIVVTWPGSGKRAVLFNKKFENELNIFYCVKNPKGVNVPKADYVSTDMGSSDMTEGKKIIRLTESDLVRLVKKVINEQGDPNAEIIKIYDNLEETKLLDSVSVSFRTQTNYGSGILGFNATIPSKNLKGQLKVHCYNDPPKFYFHRVESDEVVFAGYNTEEGKKFCSRFNIKYKGPQKPEVY